MPGILSLITTSLKTKVKSGFMTGLLGNHAGRPTGQSIGQDGSSTSSESTGEGGERTEPRFDIEIGSLSSLLDREFSRVTANIPRTDSFTAEPLVDIPEITSDNLPTIIRTFDGNIRLVDEKVQNLGRAMDKATDLMAYTKRMVERTNTLIDDQIRNNSFNRFKDIENRMESAQLSAMIDRRVNDQIAAHMAAFAEEMAAVGGQGDGGGGGLLGLGLGLGGGAAATGGAIRGAGAAARVAGGGVGKLLGGAGRLLGAVGVAMLVTDTLYGNGLGKDDEFRGRDPEFMARQAEQETQFLASIQSKVSRGEQLNATEQQVWQMHQSGQAWGTTKAGGKGTAYAPIREQTEEYGDLMGKLENSKAGGGSFFGEYGVFDLVVKQYAMTADSVRQYSKGSYDISADGVITISSRQKIVLDAPEVEILAKLSIRAPTAPAVNKDAAGTESGVTQTTGAGSGNPATSSGGSSVPGLNSGSTPSSTDGGASPVTAEGGDRVAEAFRYFKSQGWTDEQASAIVGNAMGESGPTIDFTNNTGDGGAAFGAFQWNRNGSPDRYDNFRRLYGKDLTEATWPEQMEFAQWELTSDDPANTMQKRAGDQLRESETVEEGTLIVSHGFERPNPRYANNEGRVANAQGVLANAGAYAEAAEPPPIADVTPTTGVAGNNLQFDTNRINTEGNEWKGNDPRINDIVTKGADVFGEGSPYGVRIFSGNEGRGANHVGHAVDWEIYNKETGEVVPQPYASPGGDGRWTEAAGTGGATENHRLYEQAAQAMRLVQQKDYPELSQDFRWGGYMGGNNPNDSMHVDATPQMNGATSQGSWDGGLTNKNFATGSAPSVGLERYKGMKPEDAIAAYRADLFQENSWVATPNNTGNNIQVAASPHEEPAVTVPPPASNNFWLGLDSVSNTSLDSVASNSTGDAIIEAAKEPEVVPPSLAPTSSPTRVRPSVATPNSHDNINLSASDILMDIDQIA